MRSLRVRLERQQLEFNIVVGRELRSRAGEFLRQSFGDQHRRIAILSNQRVYNLYGKDVVRSLRDSNFSITTWKMPDGERYKNFRHLEKAVAFLADQGMERADVVLALGGGVVGDLAGFAASIYLRGIALVQMPTTLLAQIDSSVGGKTGINLSVGKNLVGTFHQPSYVVIDTQTLNTLPSRELVSGFCEAVKQGAISSMTLFDQTANVLAAVRQDRETLMSEQMEELVAAHCSFKAQVVMRDERESTKRTDSRSRRILNFGHTTGHALETVTGYRRFRHGEAVGYGMLVAGQISKNVGLLDSSELESLRQAVRLCGHLPRASDLDETAIVKAIAHDKKNVDQKVKWVLLERIGRPRIVDGSEINSKLLRQSIREALRTGKES